MVDSRLIDIPRRTEGQRPGRNAPGSLQTVSINRLFGDLPRKIPSPQFRPRRDGARLGCHRRTHGQLANGISQVDYDKRNLRRAYWAFDADCAEYFI